MEKFSRCVFFFGFFATLFFIFPKLTKASEGYFELRSTTRESYRCYASSMLMDDQYYTILVSCRDLLYPAGKSVFTYALWAQPTDGTPTRRLGDLGYGRLTARIEVPFSSLFVTTESNQAVAAPAGPVVMRGDIQPYRFLDRATSPTPTNINSSEEPTNPESTLTPTPADAQSTGSKIATAFKRAGLAAFLALLALVGLVFAITRARG